MSWVDWSILLSEIIFIIYAARTVRKHTKSVADFLAANRCAGRYLLGTAEFTAAMGGISVIVYFEIFMNAGFTRQFWETVSIPIATILSLSGFVVYRYRATRAMTMAQFFEMRYSREFRIFAGILTWTSGLINFGIFPGVEARFFITFFNIPNCMLSAGGLEINVTFAIAMLVMIGISLYFTFSGGQIAIIVTDFWQGFFCTIVFIAIIVFIGFNFTWSQMCEALIAASRPGESLYNPFDISGKKEFNLTFFAIMWFTLVYNQMAWQGNQAFNCSASTPHESRMAKIVGGLRFQLVTVVLILMPLAAITVLNHSEFAEKAVLINKYLENSFHGNKTLQTQMTVPAVLKSIFPVGLLGGFAAAMFIFSTAVKSSYMHSWGSIFVQDVVCVLRKTPFSPTDHMRYLKLSIGFVAFFAFFFSLLFPLQEYIVMFMVITGAVYLGGAGSVIIGGLYWKRGSNAGAWSAMIAGCVLAVGTIMLRIIWQYMPYMTEKFGSDFPYSSQVMSFWAAITSIAIYIVVSLVGKTCIDMDKLLHRGKYAVEGKENKTLVRHFDSKFSGQFWRLIGANTNEFSKVDKGIFVYIAVSTVFWVISFFIILLLQWTGRMSDQAWLAWWKIVVCILVLTGIIGAIWVCIGGLFDLRTLYKKLAAIKRDIRDDGRVLSNELPVDEVVSFKE